MTIGVKMITAASALIISSLISSSTTVGSGLLQNKAIGDAKKESKELALLARADTKEQNAIQNKFTKQGLQLEEKKFGYEKNRDREVMNKNSLATLGTSLENLTKSGMDMQGFISSLYGNVRMV